jgi:hypothetical protein
VGSPFVFVNTALGAIVVVAYLRSTVRLKAQTAVLQTARMAYSKALQASLPSVLEQAQASETLKFN